MNYFLECITLFSLGILFEAKFQNQQSNYSSRNNYIIPYIGNRLE